MKLEVPDDYDSLRLQIAHLEQTLQAIRCGEVDALIVEGASGEQVFTRAGADRAYRTLIEEMGEGALTLASGGVITYANRRFAEMLQRPLARVIGSRIEDCFDSKEHARLSFLLEEGQRRKRTAELDLVDAKGHRVATLCSFSSLSVDAVSGALCVIVTDISEQKRSEAELRAREQSLVEVVERQRQTEESLTASLSALRLRESALGATSQGVVILDASGNVTYVNQAFVDITGYSLEAIEGRPLSVLNGPETNEATLHALREAFASACAFHGELIQYRRDGSSFWNELSLTAVIDAGGSPSQFVGVMRDVSKRRETAEQLLLAAKVFEQSSEGFFVTDAQLNIIKVNPAFTSITGFCPSDVFGRGAGLLVAPEFRAESLTSIQEETAATGRFKGEVWGRRKDGTQYAQWLSVSRVVDASSGQPTHYIASFSDITQRKEAEANIKRLAHFDPLTGLPNRALLAERAAQALQIARRQGQSMAMMFIDLDQFKLVNDSLGHAIGDRLLEAMAARFKSALRDQDTLARTGGDEFVLLLPGANANGAAHVAQKLLEIAQQPYDTETHELTITPSIGIAMFPADGTDYDALAKCADAAMYCAKQNGRNGYRFHTAELQAQSQRVLLVENCLRRAIEREQIQLYYQPQVSLRTSQVVGVEALLRWHHPELGWVSPAEFVPIAESCGLIVSLGEWVLHTAVHQLKAWRDAGIEKLTMAVNLSAVQFRQPHLPDLIRRILQQADVAADSLKLELTESVASDNPTAALALTERLHALGVHMSLDDFGTGYSSLGHLKRFKFNQLKIDQCFVRGVAAQPDDQAIVDAIINLANSLGLRTIAEGVESEQQVQFLSARGCDEVQGYFFSRPVPAHEIEARFKSGEWSATYAD